MISQPLTNLLGLSSAGSIMRLLWFSIKDSRHVWGAWDQYLQNMSCLTNQLLPSRETEASAPYVSVCLRTHIHQSLCRFWGYFYLYVRCCKNSLSAGSFFSLTHLLCSCTNFWGSANNRQGGEPPTLKLEIVGHSEVWRQNLLSHTQSMGLLGVRAIVK